MEKLLLYCTKSKPYLCYDDIQEKWAICNNLEQCDHTYFNGDIVAMCDCDLVEEIECVCLIDKYCDEYKLFLDNGIYKVDWKKQFVEEPWFANRGSVAFFRSYQYFSKMLKNNDLKKICLTPQELLDYIKLGRNGYLLHLSNIKVLTSDEKNRFGSFDCLSSKSEEFKPVTHAPQNMMKVYYGDGDVLNQEKYILLSIQPEWLCKILNGRKTIEVRRKILNKLKELIK